MQYDKMKLSVGVFVITLFIVVVTFLYFLLEQKGTFDKRYSFYLNTPSASSFHVGMPLKFSGFDIGVIDKISLNNNGTVDMIFSVSEENRKWISQGTSLMLIKPLLGSPHIEVLSALGKAPLRAGSTIKLELSDDINGMISKLEPAVDKITNILTNIETLTTTLANKDSDFTKTLHNIEVFTAKLASSDSLLTSITGDKASTKNLIASLNKTKQIMQEIHKLSKQLTQTTSTLDKKIIDPTSTTIKDVDAIMLDIKQKLDALDATVKAVGSYDNELVDIKEQISVGMQKSNQIIDKIDSLMQNDSDAKVTLP